MNKIDRGGFGKIVGGGEEEVMGGTSKNRIGFLFLQQKKNLRKTLS